MRQTRAIRRALTKAAEKLRSIVDARDKLISLVATLGCLRERSRFFTKAGIGGVVFAQVDVDNKPSSIVVDVRKTRTRRRALTKAVEKLRSIVEAGDKLSSLVAAPGRPRA